MSGEHYCDLLMEGCRVPKDYVLRDENAVRDMLSIFGVERMGNASRALALAEAAFERAVEHARTREAFGRPLAEFQGLQWKFADMRVRLDGARLLLYRAVSEADQGVPDPTNAAIAKLSANETAFYVANEALQIFGAMGYSRQLPMEYFVRRTRGWMIAGGSIEMLKNRIAEHVFDRRFDQRGRQQAAAE